MRGSLRKRGNTWSGVVYITDPETGRRKQKWHALGTNKRDAERKLNKIVADIEGGDYIEPSKQTLGEYLRQWLRDYVDPQTRATTEQGYRYHIEKQIIPNLGAIPLARITPRRLGEYYAKALKNGKLNGKGGLSPQTVGHHHRILSRAFNVAMRWGLMKSNPCQLVDPPRVPRRDPRALSIPELKTLLTFANDSPAFIPIHLAAYTGMRRSEFLGLRWMDVDLGKARLSVVQVMHRLETGEVLFEESKTRGSQRPIALDKKTVGVLRRHQEEQRASFDEQGLTWTPRTLVVCKPNGEPASPNTFRGRFDSVIRKADISNVSPHDLRHTHATALLTLGIHPKVVQERLGHARISTTLDIYSHVMPGMQEDAAAKFGEALEDLNE